MSSLKYILLIVINVFYYANLYEIVLNDKKEERSQGMIKFLFKTIQGSPHLLEKFLVFEKYYVKLTNINVLNSDIFNATISSKIISKKEIKYTIKNLKLTFFAQLELFYSNKNSYIDYSKLIEINYKEINLISQDNIVLDFIDCQVDSVFISNNSLYGKLTYFKDFNDYENSTKIIKYYSPNITEEICYNVTILEAFKMIFKEALSKKLEFQLRSIVNYFAYDFSEILMKIKNQTIKSSTKNIKSIIITNYYITYDHIKIISMDTGVLKVDEITFKGNFYLKSGENDIDFSVEIYDPFNFNNYMSRFPFNGENVYVSLPEEYKQYKEEILQVMEKDFNDEFKKIKHEYYEEILFDLIRMN